MSKGTQNHGLKKPDLRADNGFQAHYPILRSPKNPGIEPESFVSILFVRADAVSGFVPRHTDGTIQAYFPFAGRKGSAKMRRHHEKVTIVIPAPPRSACSSAAETTSGTVRR